VFGHMLITSPAVAEMLHGVPPVWWFSDTREVAPGGRQSGSGTRLEDQVSRYFADDARGGCKTSNPQLNWSVTSHVLILPPAWLSSLRSWWAMILSPLGLVG